MPIRAVIAVGTGAVDVCEDFACPTTEIPVPPLEPRATR